MQHAYFFTDQPISQIFCIICPALAIAANLRCVWQGLFSYLLFPSMTVTVGIFLCGGFGRFSSCVDLIGDFHPLKNLESIFVGIPFEVPSIYIGFILPAFREGV